MISIELFDIYSGILIFFLLLIYLFKSDSSQYHKTSNSKNGLWLSLIIGIIFIFLFGHRDYNSLGAGDSWLYAYYYENKEINVFHSNEWFWIFLIQICRDFNISTEDWFTIVSVIYIIPVIIGCHRILPNYSYTLFLAFISSFLFISNGLNGIRNGAACSIAFCAIAYAMTAKSKLDWIICAILCVLSYGTHQSTIMLIVPLLLSIKFVKSVQTAMIIWAVAILMSLFLGNTLASFVANLADDDRAINYLYAGSDTNAMTKFSGSGFRIDFLIYSAIPIIIGWYIVFVKNKVDRPYYILLNTYILSNALWVVFIRAAFSNRFAMLSWFLYPFVLIYPYIRFKSPGFNYVKSILWFQYLITLILRYK